jgi:hypothetical protein
MVCASASKFAPRRPDPLSFVIPRARRSWILSRLDRAERVDVYIAFEALIRVDRKRVAALASVIQAFNFSPGAPAGYFQSMFHRWEFAVTRGDAP